MDQKLKLPKYFYLQQPYAIRAGGQHYVLILKLFPKPTADKSKHPQTFVEFRFHKQCLYYNQA